MVSLLAHNRATQVGVVTRGLPMACSDLKVRALCQQVCICICACVCMCAYT